MIGQKRPDLKIEVEFVSGRRRWGLSIEENEESQHPQQPGAKTNPKPGACGIGRAKCVKQ
jgi:hypothetical protein